MLPEEEKEWTISVALIFTMTLNSNSGLEFNVVEFTKEHSNILAGAVILVLAGALVVNAIPSIIALFSAGAGTDFWFVDSSAVNCKRIKETMARGSIL